jgi:hypothetical protein
MAIRRWRDGSQHRHAALTSNSPAESFAALYERIGYRASTGSPFRCFETDAARRVATRVLDDLQKAERAFIRFGGS